MSPEREHGERAVASPAFAETIAAQGNALSSLESRDSHISHEPQSGGSGVTDPSSLIRKTFDDFELLEVIGQGGMGVVYKAQQKSLHRVVALKMLLSRAFETPSALERFQEEARMAAGLSHPNIVSIHQQGRCIVGPYFVMEFVEGKTLAKLIDAKPVPVKWAVPTMIAIVDAVHYAHGKGVIHRDLKPANIMLHATRGPVVMDFGLARRLEQEAGLTHLGAIIGTPAYMSPEQAHSDQQNVGPVSDVYSLGAVLYATLTGRAPYVGNTALTTLAKLVGPEGPRPVRHYRPEVSVRLEEICMRCLEKDPAKRFQTAKALSDALRKLKKKPPTVATRTVTLVQLATGKTHQVTRPRTTIGRASECTFVLRSPEVSKLHCQILLEGNDVIVEDLGSANGTLVNSQKVERVPLQHGDKLEIGGVGFEVRVK